jgi:DNA-binding response OmpR family regulator
MSGTEGIIRIREIFPEIPIIALTIYDNDTEIFNALCNGASGYLLKNTPPARLLEALKEAVDGGSPMSPSIAARVVNLFRTFRPPAHADYHLTTQETELLKLLIEGHHKKNCRRRNENFRSHRFFSPEKHLRKTASPLENRSRRQSLTRAIGLVNCELRKHLFLFVI